MKQNGRPKIGEGHHLSLRVMVILFGLLNLSDVRADEVSAQDVVLEQREHANLLNKLRSITIHDFKLHEATPKEALRYLAEKSIEADPAHRGISFAGHFRTEDLSRRITLRLEDASVKEILERLFEYGVSNSIVSVYYDHDRGEGLYSRTFILPDGLSLVGPIPPGKARERSYDLKSQLEARGVAFPPGTSATYFPEKSEVVVIATSPEQINRIDEILNP